GPVQRRPARQRLPELNKHSWKAAALLGHATGSAVAFLCARHAGHRPAAIRNFEVGTPTRTAAIQPRAKLKIWSCACSASALLLERDLVNTGEEWLIDRSFAFGKTR